MSKFWDDPPPLSCENSQLFFSNESFPQTPYFQPTISNLYNYINNSYSPKQKENLDCVGFDPIYNGQIIRLPGCCRALACLETRHYIQSFRQVSQTKQIASWIDASICFPLFQLVAFLLFMEDSKHRDWDYFFPISCIKRECGNSEDFLYFLLEACGIYYILQAASHYHNTAFLFTDGYITQFLFGYFHVDSTFYSQT